MHELSLALSLVDAACEQRDRLGGVRVESLHLRLGALSGVVKEALVFSFEAASAGTAIEGASLEIQDVPVSIWCAGCGARHALPDITTRRCPACGSLTVDVVEGMELELVALEVSDA